jgi:hypothetical protein
MANIARLSKPLTRESLLHALAGQQLPTETLSVSISADRFSEAVTAALLTLDEGTTGSSLDGALAEAVHSSLAGLPRREASDMRVWHWVCAALRPEVVWRRWSSGVPLAEDVPSVLGSKMVPRFAGSPTLNGVSRNTFARLWWVCEQLDGDYELARWALSRQDMFQAIFERLFGLYPPAAKGCLRGFPGKSEDEIRAATKWLNLYGSTTVLEMLDEGEVQAIVGMASSA